MGIRDTAYLISTIFQVMLIYKFVNAFLGKDIKVNILKYWLYIWYYLITVSVYIFIQVPTIILLSNIFMLFAITANHEVTLKRKILSVIYVYVASALSEAITLATLRMLNIVRTPFPFEDNEFLISRIASLVILYPFVLLYSNINLSISKRELPSIFWLAAIFVPLATLIPAALILFEPGSSYLAMALTTVMVFFLNFLVFYLYSELDKIYQVEMEKEIFLMQAKAYGKQIELLENQSKNMKTFKHDVINHISSLKSLIENNDNKNAISYLNNAYLIVSNTAEHVKTNNLAMNSILNYKIDEAQKLCIDINHDISIPTSLQISDIDLIAIWGNLFDNAIEALKRVEYDRVINLSFTYEDGLIIIIMENNFEGNLLFDGDIIISSKKNKDEHGLGLLSIENAVRKYDGIMNISTNSSRFRVEIMIYNKIPETV